MAIPTRRAQGDDVWLATPRRKALGLVPVAEVSRLLRSARKLLGDSLTGLAGVLAVDDLQHRRAAMAVVRESPKLVALAVSGYRGMGECKLMSVIGNLLVKCFAIVIAAAGAFVIAAYALDNNWLL
jgi:hypothetical protein